MITQLGRSNERTPLSHSSRSRHKSLPRCSPERHEPLPRRVQSIFFTMGAAVLLSWNVLITAIPYFLTRLQGSAFENTFPSYLGVSYTLLLFLSLAKATATSNPSSSASRIQHAIIIITIMLLLLTISPILPIQDGIFFFFFIIINSGIQATAGGYLQSSVVGVAALFGEQALQRYFTGQGAVGIVVSIVQYVSTAISLQREPQMRRIGIQFKQDGGLTLFAFIFFGLATLYMVISLIAHFTLVRSPLYCSVVLFKDQKDVLETTEEAESLISGEALGNSNSDDTEDDQAFLSKSIELHRRMSTSQLLNDDSTITWKIVKANVLYNTSVCLIYLVTLSVFPPITASILSVNTSQDSFFLSPALFISLHFVVFNIGDYIGRAIASPAHLPWWNQSPIDTKLCIASISRILFIPLFLICNINGSSRQSSPLINSDIAYLLILLLFAISSGYLMNIAMMGASSVEYNSRLRNLIGEVKLGTDGGGNGTVEVDLAAKIAQFCLIGGLLSGSIMSFGVKSIICGGCNPFYA